MRLENNQKAILRIDAIEYYSTLYVEVQKHEIYSLYAESNQRWIDWWIPCSADGFFNPILLNSAKRVKGVRCFTLCGTIEKDEDFHFAIGTKPQNIEILKDGKMHFFANDHRNPRYYRNNKGFINLQVTRIS